MRKSTIFITSSEWNIYEDSMDVFHYRRAEIIVCADESFWGNNDRSSHFELMTYLMDKKYIASLIDFLAFNQKQS